MTRWRAILANRVAQLTEELVLTAERGRVASQQLAKTSKACWVTMLETNEGVRMDRMWVLTLLVQNPIKHLCIKADGRMMQA